MHLFNDINYGLTHGQKTVASINVKLQTELRYRRYRYNYTLTSLRKNPKT